MATKTNSHSRTAGPKTAGGHGTFRHRAKPATLKTMLDAYGLKQSDYAKVKGMVSRELAKEAAHGRYEDSRWG